MRIQIPNPCSENWQLMSPKEQGRHCEKCSKTVVDFRAMTDMEIADFMQKNPESCGKFYNVQLDRDLLETSQNYKSKPWINAITAISLVTSQLASNDLMAQGKPMLEKPKLTDTNLTKIQCFSISNIFKFRITQPLDSTHFITKIKVELDTFSIIFDSLENQQLSFYIPFDLNYEEAKITLIENDSTSSILFVPKNNFINTNPLSYNPPTLYLYKDSASWKFVSEIPFYYNPIQYEVMGIPPMINYFDTSIFNKNYDINVFQPIAVSVDTTKDSVTLIDTPKINIKKEEITTPIESENKLNLFWKFLFFIGLGSVIYFISRKLRKGRK